MEQIFIASREILSKRYYIVGFLALIPLTIFLFVLIPVWTIPGNNLDFQLGIFSERDYILLSILSVLVSLFLIMQIFIFKNATLAKDKFKSLGTVGIGGYVAVVGSVFATTACSSCLFALFGFLGFSILIFLIERQWYIVSGAIILLIIALYFASRKVNGICDVCNMGIKKS